jgi:acyl-CoA thioester hydrolase
MQIRVYYEDTDTGGVVYYANYLKFCERARSDMFFAKGLSPHQDNQFFVVKSIQADYKYSAIFGDILTISTKLLTLKKASILLRHTIVNQDNKLIFTMDVKLAFLKDTKPSKIPNHYLDIFN